MSITEIPNELMIDALERSGDYRILRRLPPLPREVLPDNGDVRRGLYVDTETTGLDVKKDEVIELGAIPFMFRTDGNAIQAMEPLHWYNEPTVPISDEAASVTGITIDKVRGHKIDREHFGAVVEATDIVIAHNAGFDRRMLERIEPKLIKKCWGCSQTQVPWESKSTKLEWLTYLTGHFYDAHGALADCHAGMSAIMRSLGESTGLAHILEASRKTSCHVWAVGAPYDLKDALKDRKYYWNGGEDGRPKAWHKEIGADEKEGEMEWLRSKMYRKLIIPARFNDVTAFDRFTDRG